MSFWKSVKKVFNKSVVGKAAKKISRSDWNPGSKITARGYHRRRETEAKRDVASKISQQEAQERAYEQKMSDEKKKRQMEEADARRAGNRGLRGRRRSLLTGDDRGMVQGDTTG